MCRFDSRLRCQTQATNYKFRKAADLINSKFNKYRTAQPNHSAERYSTTVLVDIAVQLLQLQQEKSVDPLVSSMKQLNLEVEEVLNEE